jgi:hypothetical protein
VGLKMPDFQVFYFARSRVHPGNCVLANLGFRLTGMGMDLAYGKNVNNLVISDAQGLI